MTVAITMVFALRVPATRNRRRASAPCARWSSPAEAAARLARGDQIDGYANAEVAPELVSPRKIVRGEVRSLETGCRK